MALTVGSELRNESGTPNSAVSSVVPGRSPAFLRVLSCCFSASSAFALFGVRLEAGNGARTFRVQSTYNLNREVGRAVAAILAMGEESPGSTEQDAG